MVMYRCIVMYSFFGLQGKWFCDSDSNNPKMTFPSGKNGVQLYIYT